jgi:hypothetical protein
MIGPLRPVALDREDVVGISIFALVSSHHGTRSDDSGKKIAGDGILPFLPHISSILVRNR